MLEFSLTIFSLLIIYLINKYRKEIGKKTRLIDKPDKIRKLHKKPTPLLGGIMAFSSFLLINLYLIFLYDLNKTSFIIFACCLSCLILGLIDDVKRVSYKYKFLILITVFYLFISLDHVYKHDRLLAKLQKYNPIFIKGSILEVFTEVTSFNKIIAAQGTFSFWACLLSSAEKIYWPMTNDGPNSNNDVFKQFVNLKVDDEPRYEFVDIPNIYIN